MRFVERIKHARPTALAEAPVDVEVAEGVGAVEGGQSHALEQGVANHERHAATIGNHLVAVLDGHRARLHARVGPFVHKARVDGAYHEPQPGHDVVELLGAALHRYGAVERAICLGEVAQQDTLAARDLVLRDVALKVAAGLEHVAQDRLGTELVVVCPRDLRAVRGERNVEHLLERLGVGDVLQTVEALLKVDALRLHGVHRRIAGATFLRSQDLLGVLERRLDHGDEVEGVRGALRIKQLERREQKRRERLVEGEVLR